MKTSYRGIRNLKPFLSGRLPGQLIIQYSNRCNADCPQCGMRRSEKITRTTLDKGYVKKLIDSAAQKGIQSLSFTGGEPLLYLDDIIELTNHASEAGIPFIRTGTNGFFLRNPEDREFIRKINCIAEKLASTDIYTFWISLDSANPDDHESLRGLPGVVKGIEKALPIFHDHGIYPSVNLGINRATGGRASQPFLGDLSEEDFQISFEEAFNRFYSFVYDLGFTIVNSCYPMSSETPEAQELNNNLYGAASSDSMITFSRREKALIFRALFQTIPKFRGKLRIFSPRCALYNLIKKFDNAETPMFPCRGGEDFFFVASDTGKIHPCGYREEEFEQLPDLRKRNGKNMECDRCEWECFRDPSDVLGPFAELFTHPVKLLGKIRKNPIFFKLLMEDIRYYRACDYFNGRSAPQLG